MKEVSINVPDEMVTYIKHQNHYAELVRNALLLYQYINDGNISYGKAAEILEITKYELIEITLVAMWKHIAIFTKRIMQRNFKLYKVDMKYIRNFQSNL
jgi:hypothetical protein